MWIIAVVVGIAAFSALAVALGLRHTGAANPLGWRLLAHSGWPLAVLGAMTAARTWTPTPGPYVPNVRYPYGTHLAAWQVSFGFTWIAFGLLFTALAVLARDAQRPIAWWALFATWGICWLPHGYIGVATAFGGLAPNSMASYQQWAAKPFGTLTLATEAVLLVAHVALAFTGFVLTGYPMWRTPASAASES